MDRASRRVGQSRQGIKPLLGQIHGKSRVDYDRDSIPPIVLDTEDDDDSDVKAPKPLAPTNFTEGGHPVFKKSKTNAGAGMPNLELSLSVDDLSKTDAPSIRTARASNSKSASSKRSTVKSVVDSPDDLAREDAPSVSRSLGPRGVGRTAGRRDGDGKSTEGIDPPNILNFTAFFGGLASGKTTEEAVRSAGRRFGPPGWDDGSSRSFKTQTTYANRKSTAPYGKKKPAPTRPKVEANLGSTFDLDSDSLMDSSDSEKGKENKKPNNSEKGDEFVDPTAKYALAPTPPPSKLSAPPPSTTFTNPLEKWNITPAKGAYDYLGADSKQKPASTTFMDPLSKYADVSEPKKPAGNFEEYRNGQLDNEIINIESSPVLNELGSSQSSGPITEKLDTRTNDMLNDMAAQIGIDVNLLAHRANDGKDRCKLCDDLLPEGILDKWRTGRKGFISLQAWQQICQEHKQLALNKEWKKKGYPDIEWGKLKDRVAKHIRLLKNIISNKTSSHFRDAFAQEQKETRGNTAKFLKEERRLPNPGYYGPRGGEILLHTIMAKLGNVVSDAAKRDPLIAGSSVSAFIQHVLVLELATQLIKEDMHVSAYKARKILEESQEIGEKLNAVMEHGDLYDAADEGWVDINVASKQQDAIEIDDEEWPEMDW